MKVHDVKDKLLRAYAMNIADVMLKFVEVDDLLEDLWRKKNPVIDSIIEVIQMSSLQYENPRYQRLTFRIGIYALWVCVMDEAYQEFLYELLWNTLERISLEEVKKRWVDPAEWRVNRIWRKQGEQKS